MGDPSSGKRKFRRVLLKLSGEALREPGNHDNISPPIVEDIAAQIEGEVAVLKLADPGSPTLVQDKDSKGALYVLMPMRV